MPASDQNVKSERYQIIPRVLIFVTRGDLLLLLKIKGKGRWDGRYNGLGGHIERGESLLEAARRELMEESGLQAELRLVGTLLVDTGENPGIGLFIFTGEADPGELVPSDEGDLVWIPLWDVGKLPLLDDVPILLRRIVTQSEAGPFSARSYYDETGSLKVIFAR